MTAAALMTLQAGSDADDMIGGPEGSPTAPTWRISVKREAHGIASRFLHDRTGIGDEIDARPTQGDFTLPPDDRPRFLSAP